MRLLPRNKYPEETVQKIIETSLKLFLEKGYEQTTVLDIVANLGGLTRGAFYHHFKSKEEVLEAIFAARAEEYHPFEAAMQAKVANGLERLRLALKTALMENISTEQNTAVTQFAFSLMSNPRFLQEKLKGDIKTAAMLAPIIEEGMKDGSIRPGNPKIIAELFMILANIWMMPSIFPAGHRETLEKANLIAEIMENVGCPVLDEEMWEIFEKVIGIIDEHYHEYYEIK